MIVEETSCQLLVPGYQFTAISGLPQAFSNSVISSWLQVPNPQPTPTGIRQPATSNQQPATSN